MQLIDSHAHIYLPQFKEDRDQMLSRATEAGISRIYMPNIDHRTIDEMLELEAHYPQQCHAMMGLHPSSVDKHFEQELYRVEEWLNRRPFAAIGETGIDLYWDKTFSAQQEEALKIQVEWAKKFGLPIVLHTRNAFDETFRIIKEHHSAALRGVFHCFSGTLEEAKQVLELGTFYLGIGGVATYKNGGLEPVLQEIALEHLLLETDAPYLPPVPHRGKRNEPAYMALVAEK